MNDVRVFRHAHLACGIGAGARGFNMANPRVGNISARFECAGGIDVDAAAIRNFEKLTGVKGTVLDLFSREQFIAFHGREPSIEWREASPADIRAAFGPEVDVCFTSMPCKGFSGLLSQRQSETERYQALNGLTLRAIWLQLEAYKDDPIAIILFENVPRIANRGRWLLDQIIALLRHYGYAVAETVHDCGELGGLAQSRKRFLLVARHMKKVPPFVYQPPKLRLRGVGEVIGKLPLPGDLIAGPMHRVPSLQWQTWVRLAFVPAGKDWRALNDLQVVDGMLKDFGIMPEVPLRENALGVCGWDDTAPVVTAARAPGQGRFSVADPRPADCRAGAFGVNGFDEPIGTVQGESLPSNGKFAVADPRIKTDREGSGRLGVRDWNEPSGTVAGGSRPENGAYSVADPRPGYGEATHRNVLGVKGWEEPAGVVTGNPKPTGGAHAVADPRVHNGHPKSVQLGVRSFKDPAPCVKGDMSVGTGPYAVADPRQRRGVNQFKIVRLDGKLAGDSGLGGSLRDQRLGAGAQRAPDSEMSVRQDGREEGQGASADARQGRLPVSGPLACGDGADEADASAPPRTADIHRSGSGRNRKQARGRDAAKQHAGQPELGSARGQHRRQADAWDAGERGEAPQGEDHGGRRPPDPNVGTQPEDVGPALSDASGCDPQHSGSPDVEARRVADPRSTLKSDGRGSNKYRVTAFEEPAGAVIGGEGHGAFAVADPRGGPDPTKLHGKYPVERWDETSRTVIGGADNGAFAVADPRPEGFKDGRQHFEGGGHYGVIPWEGPAGTVSASGCYDNGRNSVADPRPADLDVEPVPLPAAKDRLVCRIVSLDETWHRPFTTLELAALQSIVDPEEAFELTREGAWRAREGFDLAATSDATKREWIGNAVPSAASCAMATTIGETLLLAGMGETFTLSTREIWVKPLALALAVDTDQLAVRMDGGHA